MVGEGTAGGEETCWVNRGGGEKKEKGCMCGRNKVGNYIVGLGERCIGKQKVLCMKGTKEDSPEA